MRHTVTFLVLALALSATAGAQMMSAQSMGGMNAMQYYVGSWNCMAGNVGEPMSHATATYTLDAGLLHEMVMVPAQGKMKTAYTVSIATSYDAKNKRYVQTGLDNMSGWWVDYGKLSGKNEQWADRANSGKLGRSQTVRTDANHFSFMSWETMDSAKPNFKGSCTRST